MNFYKKILDNLNQFKESMENIDNYRFPFVLSGVSDISKMHIIYSLTLRYENLNFLVLVKDDYLAKKFVETINLMAGYQKAFVYNCRDFVFKNLDAVSREYEQMRLGVLSRLMSSKGNIIVASIDAAMQYTIPPYVLADKTKKIHDKMSIDIHTISSYFIDAGYVKRNQVDGIAQFSVRGGIVDCFPPNCSNPIRIEFWGDEIDTISYFDVDTQRRTCEISQFDILPSREVIVSDKDLLIQDIESAILSFGSSECITKSNLKEDVEKLREGILISNLDKYLPFIYRDKVTLFDYFENPLIFIDEYTDVKVKADNFLNQHYEDIKFLIEQWELFPQLGSYCCNFDQAMSLMEKNKIVYMDEFIRTHSKKQLNSIIKFKSMKISPWNGNFKSLVEDLNDYIKREYTCIILCMNDKSLKILFNDLTDNGFEVMRLGTESELLSSKVYLTIGNLPSGFEYPDAKVVLITNSKASISKKVVKKSKGEEIGNLSDLSVGDPVVHVFHGIGLFEGINKLDVQGIVKDYIKIKYSGSDVLYVPVTQLDLVSRYIGSKNSSKIKLNKLNSGEWQKTRSRVKKAVSDMADKLIQLYAQRMDTKGHAFSVDNESQKDFEAYFPYEETADQLRCISEIKGDMQKSSPMDRLLCGDVGFGKTEVALRAAFKCVLDGKQCAILCPTTILAWQHYNTAVERMQNFPVNIDFISRFRTKKEQKEIIKDVANGKIDIIIGTHRLVQNDIQFNDLGLAIIDEEQRFGVAHKEKFKDLFKGVDVLTLSATPIPRTLNMAISGIRDMSVIEEPPQDRQPIQTYVLEHDMSIICDAIRREMYRLGQVYYIHNKVETVEACAKVLSKLIPDARVGFAHGRMSESELVDIWKSLIEKKIDILVCTTIIETGVDIANCNTLIIEDADRMGLAQLYQLRGRIGRSNKKAFAYFTFKPDTVLSEIASKRLAAIKEFTQFGSGYKIALRDLEIRGAGNVLGASQHGHMEDVGYDMYVKLLSDEINRKKGKKQEHVKSECLVDLRTDAHIPENYIDDLSQRLYVYRKIAGIESAGDVSDMINELEDRFGKVPNSVRGLINVSLFRNVISKFGFFEVSQKNDKIILYNNNIDMNLLSKFILKFEGRVNINAGKESFISIDIPRKSSSIDVVEEIVDLLQV